MRYLLLLLPVLVACNQKKSKDIVVDGVKVKAIPGLTATVVHDPLAGKGFKLTKEEGGEVNTWTSVESNEMHEFKVISTSTAKGDVISVQASSVSMLTLDQAARDFFANVATVSYKYADPQKARDWVLANLDKGGNTTIGDVNFEITVNNETSRTLRITKP